MDQTFTLASAETGSAQKSKTTTKKNRKSKKNKKTKEHKKNKGNVNECSNRADRQKRKRKREHTAKKNKKPRNKSNILVRTASCFFVPLLIVMMVEMFEFVFHSLASVLSLSINITALCTKCLHVLISNIIVVRLFIRLSQLVRLLVFLSCLR